LTDENFCAVLVVNGGNKNALGDDGCENLAEKS
jgi:hypothetical protein